MRGKRRPTKSRKPVSHKPIKNEHNLRPKCIEDRNNTLCRDHSDSRVPATRLLVCYPSLLGIGCASHLCGSVGDLMIFKQRQYSKDGDETSQEQEELSLVKWVVIVPELRISRTFLEEPNCSLDQFIIRHYRALDQLDNLRVVTL